jgi:hypothetical protein
LLAVDVRGQGTTATDYTVILAMDQRKGLRLRDDVDLPDGGCACPRTSTYASGPATSERWTQLEVALDFAKQEAVAIRDGVVLTTFQLVDFTAQSLTLRLGGNSYDTLAAFRFDDFRCDVTR